MADHTLFPELASMHILGGLQYEKVLLFDANIPQGIAPGSDLLQSHDSRFYDYECMDRRDINLNPLNPILS